MENKLFYYTTYSMNFAIAALEDGLEVQCCHPEEFFDCTFLTTREQIEDAEDHLFLVTFKDGT